MFLSLKSAKIPKHYKNYLKNFVNLVDFWLPWEQRLLRQQLPKNTPHWPHVYGCGIFLERRERKSHLRKTRKIFSLSCLEALFGVFFEQNTHNQSHTQEPGLSCIYFQILITVNYEQYQCTQTFQDERWKSPHWRLSFLLIKQHSGQTSAFFWQGSCHCSLTNPDFTQISVTSREHSTTVPAPCSAVRRHRF